MRVQLNTFPDINLAYSIALPVLPFNRPYEQLFLITFSFGRSARIWTNVSATIALLKAL